ncbi:MAG: DM13 domain-containing protein [Nitrosarchaeum sp.]|jgi:hypothetical protein|uniref:DM13 domain-containing protein n=1 Tax=Nitrosarchaeum sp. TaxID=2026886 RepID=UPI002DE9333F|nr:DM13 domain-containing protein [Nitrosarchaeum sp.]
MNKLIIVALVAIIGIGGAYAISPYFTSSTVNEALPNSAIPLKMEDTPIMKDEPMMENEPMMEDMMIQTYGGTFVGVGDGIHDAQGIVRTIPLNDGNNVLRLENFKATNGPDLYVYLSTDNKASEFVSLGKLKANNGNQNYDIPENTDLEKYSKVLIWCKAFGVLFGNADLSPQ